MAFVRLVRELGKEKEIGQRAVTDITDEDHTYAPDSKLPTAKHYNQHGQSYTTGDAKLSLEHKHADGHSILLSAANPAVVTYDPAWSFEIAHIVRAGLHRMYGETGPDGNGENVFYYLTVYNEPYQQPAEPENLDVDGLLRGLYRYSDAPSGDGPEAQILVSGVTMPDALKAQRMLA